MTSPAPTRLICAPWAGIADLPDTRPTLDNDVWDDLLWQASEMLYIWSGKQFSGGCASTVVYDTPPHVQGYSDPYWYYQWAAGVYDPWRFRCVGEKLVALLPDAPVTGITSVTDKDGNPVDYIAELPAGTVYRRDGHGWERGTTISYTHGIAPPVGGKLAAITLALELGKSRTGAKCNLPKRIENVTRQGLTVSMASVDWGTGIWEIDSWLRSVNPRQMTRRASAWSPDAPRLRRITS